MASPPTSRVAGRVRIKQPRETGKHRPPCQAKVRVARERNTRTAQNRIARAAQLNVDPTVCGARSDFLMDDVPMCRAHAGAAALLHLMKGEQS